MFVLIREAPLGVAQRFPIHGLRVKLPSDTHCWRKSKNVQLATGELWVALDRFDYTEYQHFSFGVSEVTELLPKTATEMIIIPFQFPLVK